MSLKGTKTEQNLLKAFACESQARNRYEMFAIKAREEGYEQIAAIFEETALHERAHARRFFGFLEGGVVEITAGYPAGKVGTTAENLEASANGEHEEWADVYPEFAKIAKEEGFPAIAAAFNMIAKAESEHETRYRKLLENVKTETVFKKEGTKRWQCRYCGYVHEGPNAPEKCPACLQPKAFFQEEMNNY